MQLNIFNKEIVYEVEPTFNISFEDIETGFKKIFRDSILESVNIVFVSLEYIQDLNMRYRDINSPTDVLSFKILDDGKQSEIYICPEYVYTSFQGDMFEEEILRLIVHGTLHIFGHEHTQSLMDSPNEEMFVLQESLVLRYKKICY